MSGDVDVAAVCGLMAEPARASILLELLGGEPLPAGELARRAGLTPSGASNHLARLLAGGLVAVEQAGRQRRYRLAGVDVAEVLEALGRIAPPPRVAGLRSAERREALARARFCYDHLAGRLGVALVDRLTATRILRPLGDGYDVTARGRRWFLDELGIDTDEVRLGRRHFATGCLDLTERRPHLAGSLGAALGAALQAEGVVRRIPGGRALRVTAAGERRLAALGVPPA